MKILCKQLLLMHSGLIDQTSILFLHGPPSADSESLNDGHDELNEEDEEEEEKVKRAVNPGWWKLIDHIRFWWNNINDIKNARHY